MRLSPEAIARIQEHIEFAFAEGDEDYQVKSDLQTLLDFYFENTKEPFSHVKS